MRCRMKYEEMLQFETFDSCLQSDNKDWILISD